EGAGAGDDSLAERPVVFAPHGPFLTLSVNMPELADAALRKRLSTGFVSTIVLRAYLYREGETRPLGFTARTSLVSYDLWDEVYRVKIQDPQGELNLRLHSADEALARISQLALFPLVPLARVAPGVGHFAAIIVEVNPISPELLAKVRRWLTHPEPGARMSGGETFLGSFVSVFVNGQVSQSERVVRFRSQVFRR